VLHQQNRARLLIQLFGLLFFIGLSSVSGPAKADANLVSAIGSAAFRAIEEIPGKDSAGTRLRPLTQLASTLLRAGNVSETRLVLEKARSIESAAVYDVAEVFALSVRVGDRDAAMIYIQKASDIVQLQALKELVLEQGKEGNLAGVDATLELLAALWAKAPREPARQQYAEQPQIGNFQFNYDYVFCDLGKAFAVKGDIPRALTFIDRISNPLTRYVLVREIAKAQHKAGDEAGVSKSLRQLSEDVEKYYAQRPFDIALSKALSFGDAGAVEPARAIIDALPLKEDRDRLYADLSQTLARSGDIADAKKIAEAFGQVNVLVLIGDLQSRVGDEAEALKTFIAARDMMQASGRIGPTMNIVKGLVSAGAFSEALQLSSQIDDLNRQQIFPVLIKEEARRSDIRALKETAPVAFQFLQSAKMPLYERDYADIVLAFSKAGLADETLTARSLAKKNSQRLGAIGRALLSPERLKLKEVDDAIERQDLAAAAGGIRSLSADLKDAGLFHLTIAQVDAGQPREAYDTARGIVEPYQRYEALRRIVEAASKASP
jgi:hypothetical protein